MAEFEKKIEQAEDPFMSAIQYAIVGNIIDFNPIHNTLLEDILDCFENMDQLELAIDDSHLLMKDILHAGTLLYSGNPKTGFTSLIFRKEMESTKIILSFMMIMVGTLFCNIIIGFISEEKKISISIYLFSATKIQKLQCVKEY